MARIYWNRDWKFTEEYREELLKADYDDSLLESVCLPHTCKETPLHYFDESIYQMVSGYRKTFLAPKEWEGKKILLTVEGAAHESTVFLNGEKIGEHHCGYTAFTLDLSEVLKYGEENILVIRVDSRESLDIPPFGFVIDYMTYGGLYREVYLDILNQDSFKDIFLHSEIQMPAASGAMAGASLVSEIELYGALAEGGREEEGKKELWIRQSIRKRGEDGYRMVLREPWKRNADSSGTQPGQFRAQVGEVTLWDVDCPMLYEIKTELIGTGIQGREEVLDERVMTFGFRRSEFLADGFYLNGRKLKIRGLNRHQSYPYVGYAMPKSMQRRDADILKKELGLNAVRTSHYPQSHHFLNRCDELGLLVFTEMPGWQHIGGKEWKEQAVQNVRDMVRQYRNHTSIILWGVRINESVDDDEFYRRTNEAAHELDPTRPTGGVRAHKKSSLLEDVYTYNDFIHDGRAKGCEKKSDVTSDMGKPYLISEYNGHMYPTKSFDCEEHRVEHAIRHVRVLDAVSGEEDIAGSFGWCMTDYNTHKDFGSGDRICYHGVLDMFRNPKLAAAVYACQQEEEPVLEIASSMDIGEHPGCNRGRTYILTNADRVRMFKNNRFIKEFRREEASYKHLKHGPIVIDDFIGDAIEEGEDFKPNQAAGVKKILNAAAVYGMNQLPKSIYMEALKLILIYHMNPSQAVELYNKYIGDWGGTSTTYGFEAIKDGAVVKSIVKQPMRSWELLAKADHSVLEERETYDVAAVYIKAVDENDNLLSYSSQPLTLEVEGPVEVIGPDMISLQGGMGGTYIRSKGEPGEAVLHIRYGAGRKQEVKLQFQVVLPEA